MTGPYCAICDDVVDQANWWTVDGVVRVAVSCHGVAIVHDVEPDSDGDYHLRGIYFDEAQEGDAVLTT